MAGNITLPRKPGKQENSKIPDVFPNRRKGNFHMGLTLAHQEFKETGLSKDFSRFPGGPLIQAFTK